jgi:hypothetical protein
MRNRRIPRRLGALVAGTIALLLALRLLGDVPEAASPTAPAAAESPPGVAVAAAATAPARLPSKNDKQTVQMGTCDGGAPVEVSKNLKGKALADSLMDQWKRNHPEANWVTEEKEKHALKPPADNSGLLQGAQGKAHTYGNYTERDILVWARETEKFVAEGSRIFHSADLLGSEVAVSCDMCHPHAANTHPETYPKYQVQLGRVALLRDMINWCIENPVRGEKLAADSPTMRALEAYILSQRKGVPMDYGKH